MATAPALRSPVNSTTVTGTNPTSATVTFAVSDVAVGDLIVASWISTAAPASALSVPTAKFSTTTCATLVQDVTTDDGTRYTYIWSGICTVAPGSTAVVVTLTLPNNSGTRRLVAFSINPGTSQRWDSARAVRTLSGTLATQSGTNNPWTAPWSASTSNGNPEFPVYALSHATTAIVNLDWGDGNGSLGDSIGNASIQLHLWARSVSSTSGYATNTLASTSTVSITPSGSSPKAWSGVLYAVADPVQGRGKEASKATGTFTLIKTASGRGNSASKATGRGEIATSVKTASGRGNNASKASWIVSPKTASGRGRSVADSTASAQHTVISSGQGKAASKATAMPLVIRPTPARGNAASKATGKYTVTRRISARGNSAAAGVAKYFFAIAPRVASGRGKNASSGKGKGHIFYQPTVLSDFTSTLITDIGTTSTVAINIGTTFTYILNDGGSSTIVENIETTLSFAVSDGHTTTLET